MSNEMATWDYSINTTCPVCEEYFDIANSSDFWDGRTLKLCETMTKRSRNIEVVCPKCDHEFKVDLEH